MSEGLRTVVTGTSGRMGSLITRLVRDTAGFMLAGAIDQPVASLEAALANAQVVIDFTTPEASVGHARLCAAAGVPLVVGSTGFNAESKAQMAEAAKKIPLVLSPNMSVGVNLVIELASVLAKRLGDGFDVEIVETHHRMKKDAPSGTAVRLADELAKALGRTQDDIRTSRVGQIGERPAKEIGVQTLRGGDVVGEHTVFFFGDGERVELTHRATSREQFARGALRAAKWVVGKPAGLYDMTHVLGVNA